MFKKHEKKKIKWDFFSSTHNSDDDDVDDDGRQAGRVEWRTHSESVEWEMHIHMTLHNLKYCRPMPDTMHQKTILQRIKKSCMYGIKSVCASHVQHSLRFCEMHRNFSLYSSLALAGSFFLFIFNASDSPSLSCVCVCVRSCVVVMQKFKICICRLFHSFHSLSIILRFWWKKAGKKHTQKSRGWWKKSIKLHCCRCLGTTEERCVWQLFENMKLKSFAILHF